MPSKWWICKYARLWEKRRALGWVWRRLVERRSCIAAAKKKKKIFHSVAHISGSAFKEKVSSDCRQKLPQTPSYLWNYGQLISLTIKDASRIKDAAGLLKRFQRVAWKASESARLLRAHRRRSVEAWEGAVPLTWCWRIKYSAPRWLRRATEGKDVVVHASKIRASSDEYNPFPVCGDATDDT